ncbi:MAG: hypothetical protein V1870_05100, partial [Candidatus Aenigmatarchaeota archaeon]
MSFIRRVKVGKYTYLREVRSVWENGRTKQKFVRHVGKEIDGKKKLNGSIENSEITNVKIYGPLLVLNEIAKEIGLHDILGNYSNEILSMVYSHCIDPKSLNKMEEWFTKTELNHILKLEKLTERRLSDSLDNINIDKRIEYFQQKIFTALKNKYKVNTDIFFYDVTNVYFFGTHCKIAKRGKNKSGGFKRQVQIGLAVTNNGIPILHKTFAGDVFDSRTLFDIMENLKSFGLEKLFLVWDRGITSKINISDAKKLGFEVVCGVPMKQNIAKMFDEFIKGEDFIMHKNRIQLKNCAYYAIKKKYKFDNVQGYIYICLNRKKQIEDQEDRLKKIHEAKELLKKGRVMDKSLSKYFEKNGEILRKIVQEEEKHDGISILFCTENLSAENVIKRYFDKDTVEKAFACIKGVIKLRPVRKWLEERVIAHIFICHLSYLLLSIMEYKFNKKNIPFSSIEALEILETMYKIYIYDPKTKNSFIKIVNLTEKQTS